MGIFAGGRPAAVARGQLLDLNVGEFFISTRIEAMLPWDQTSKAYKTAIIGSFAFSILGIVLAIIGSNMQNLPVMFTAIGLLVVGILIHIVGLFIRTRDLRAYRRSLKQ